ncbi:MAG: copper resistance protein NlpE [Cardiobacteriaceae bacterium]|nr:copper resistance protein NlpE [Cardiobacteriaceae bacterium]
MKHIALALAVSAALLAGCKEEKKPEAPKTEAAAPAAVSEAPKAEAPAAPAAAALDGTYKGVLPCASCEGIETTLVLKDGMAYELTTLFLGEKDAKPETLSGSYTRDGDLVKLDATGNENVYLVTGNLLEMRNADGSDGGRSEEERANYRLQKQ